MTTHSPLIQALEWGIDVVGWVSGWLLGNRRRSGWLLGVVVQLVWLPVAAVTGQWAFVVLSFGAGATAVRGWLRWRRPVDPVEAVAS